MSTIVSNALKNNLAANQAYPADKFQGNLLRYPPAE